MVVLTFSHILPQTLPPTRATFSRPARHVHRLIRSPPSRPFPVLAPVRRSPRSSTQENGGASETLEEEDVAAADEETSGRKKEGVEQAAALATSSVPEEIKEMMEAKKSSAPDLWAGVVEEVREIEWPAFGRVLGTTGVVLAVIAGSSIALLTVNAILAEISDGVFAGRGVQDFFG